jgi:hypothetical protein
MARAIFDPDIFKSLAPHRTYKYSGTDAQAIVEAMLVTHYWTGARCEFTAKRKCLIVLDPFDYPVLADRSRRTYALDQGQSLTVESVATLDGVSLPPGFNL